MYRHLRDRAFSVFASKTSKILAARDHYMVVNLDGFICWNGNIKPLLFKLSATNSAVANRSRVYIVYAVFFKIQTMKPFIVPEWHSKVTQGHQQFHKKVKYADLYSASSRKLALISTSQPDSQASANTARPRIRVGVSRDMPVYSPGFCRVLIPSFVRSPGLFCQRLEK